jgi:homocysteine S-methyltransferase
MSLYRNALPQLGKQVFLSDGGLETTLIFHDELELPYFAAFDLLKDEQGMATLRKYYEAYLDVAIDGSRGFILETATWRANADWGKKLGYDRQQLAAVNRQSVAMLEELRNNYTDRVGPVVISGNLGPRGDGYRVDSHMSAAEAREYHGEQIHVFANTNVDMVSAITLNYAEEAIGIAQAAAANNVPVVIGFTTETDGRLPSGQTLQSVIEQVDEATNNEPAYYMINCAHTDHFSGAIADNEEWPLRIRGIRANASRCSHAELDASETLDDGDPIEFGQLYRQLCDRFPQLTVLGGCCGTDHRHIQEVSLAVC